MENFVRTLGGFLRKTTVEGKSWKKVINQFMLNYRATPHSTTTVSPTKLLFQRSIKTKLPQAPNLCEEKIDSKTVKKRDAKQKQKMKDYTDTRKYTAPSNLEIGDSVLLKQRKCTQLSTPFEPYRIVSKKGSMIVVENSSGKRLARNSTHVKRIPKNAKTVKPNSVEYSDSTIADDPDLPVVNPDDHVHLPPRRYPQRDRRAPLRFRDFE